MKRSPHPTAGSCGSATACGELRPGSSPKPSTPSEGRGDGHHFKVMGPHDADVDRLLEALRTTRIRQALSHPSLELHPRGKGWIARGDAVEGRLEWSESGLLYDVMVDGHRMPWEEFGRVLEPFDGQPFTLRFEDAPLIDPKRDEEETGTVIPLAGRSETGRDDMAPNEDPEEKEWELELEDDEELLAAWDRAEAAAVDLLREALPEVAAANPPGDALREVARRLRSGMRSRTWPYEHMRRAAGWKPESLPSNDPELWLGAAGGLISAREETGLDTEEESTVMALEHADWLGAVVGLVRAGVGASAEPEALVGYIDACPEVDGTVDPDDASLVETAFELVLPAWEAAGAVDEDRRLTSLGWWGLPRALASAWSGEFDRNSDDRS